MKYLVLAPFACHSIYTFFMSKDESERDMFNILLLPLTLFRMVHYQTWISLSRYRTAKGNNRILDKSIEFDQVDRESNWWVPSFFTFCRYKGSNKTKGQCKIKQLFCRDDEIILFGLVYYIGYLILEQAHHMPMWRTDGIVITALLHIGPVEFLYYWLHRALHHHFLYSRYHSHHHSSIVTEPISGNLSSKLFSITLIN